MKKLLALVLALVMTLGLATVGTNAAVSTELKDADKIKGGDYEEAINVVKAIDVMVGDNEGNFRPTDALNRAEGAKIVAYLIATNKVAADLVGTGNKFTDVPATFWDGNGAGMIEYCAVNGIINGVGDNKFDPQGSLTVVAFAKMMLTALGYDGKIEGYVNDVDWQTHVMTRANRIGLLANLSGLKATDVITREQAAQMVFNTLKTPIVEYSNKGTNFSVNGAEVSVGASEAKPVTNDKQARQTIFDNRVNDATNIALAAYVVEFAEEYYPALVRTDDTDIYGRPSNRWTMGREVVGTYQNKDLLVKTYEVRTKGSTVYADMGSHAYKYYQKQLYVDGVYVAAITYDTNGNALGWGNTTGFNQLSAINASGSWLGFTGRGVKTEMYVYDDPAAMNSGYVRLVVTNTWLAEVTSELKNGDNIRLNVFTQYTNDQAGIALSAGKAKVDGDAAALKEGDYVLVQMTNGLNNYGTTAVNANARADGAVANNGVLARPGARTVQFVKLAEKITDAYCNAYTTNATDGTEDYMYSVTTNGTEYFLAALTRTNQDILQTYRLEQLLNFTYDLYKDLYGNVIGIEYHTKDTSFVFITGIERTGSYISAGSIKANVIWPDGTMETKTLKLNTKNSVLLNRISGVGAGDAALNSWFVYSKTESGDIMLNGEVGDGTAYTSKTILQANDTLVPPAIGSNISIANTTLRTVNGAMYGNDNTVYITAKVDEKFIDDANGKGAITQVNGVTTGIKNANIKAVDTQTLTTPTAAEAARGITSNFPTGLNAFYVYNTSTGYVMYAVVVSADQGGQAVFITDGQVKREYIAGIGYVDTYDAIMNGEEVELKVNSTKSNTSTGNKLDPNSLYLVRFDGDYVVNVEDTPIHELNTDTNKQFGYAKEIALWRSITIKGNTLWVNDENGDNVGYIMTNDKTAFWVYDAVADSYTRYYSASSAFAAAEPTQLVAGNNVRVQTISEVYAECDKGTGIASTVVFISELDSDAYANWLAGWGFLGAAYTNAINNGVAKTTANGIMDDYFAAVKAAKTQYTADKKAGISETTAQATMRASVTAAADTAEAALAAAANPAMAAAKAAATAAQAKLDAASTDVQNDTDVKAAAAALETALAGDDADAITAAAKALDKAIDDAATPAAEGEAVLKDGGTYTTLAAALTANGVTGTPTAITVKNGTKVTVAASDSPVTLTGDITVSGENSEFNLASGATVTAVNVTYNDGTKGTWAAGSTITGTKLTVTAEGDLTMNGERNFDSSDFQ